ncbi:MAG: hypothetical protein N2260_04770, partial [Syntrophobacterales bacterium]|nr:hypothetical protein [Syntrophobacterales bacterium]
MGKRIILITAIVLGLSCNVWGGAWLQPKGYLFLSIISYYYKTDTYFDSHGNEKDREGTFTKFEVNPYLEYGFTEEDTIILNIFYDWLKDDRGYSSVKSEGFSDLEIGWRRLLWTDGSRVVSSQLNVIVPLGYSIEDSPRLGYGRYGIEGFLQYGTSFILFERRGFLDLALGPRIYIGYPSDQIRAKFSAGYDLFRILQLIGGAELHWGIGNGSAKWIGQNITLTPEYKLLKLSLSGCFRLTP